MLAYNLKCWLQLFNREQDANVAEMQHTTPSTARLRFSVCSRPNLASCRESGCQLQ
jgi:hypothetical protein